MWELHRLLTLDNPTGDLMEDTKRILSTTPPPYIDTALHLLYGNITITDGMTLLLLLLRGLRVNEFFKFHVLLFYMRQ